jgi:hypothetical protein
VKPNSQERVIRRHVRFPPPQQVKEVAPIDTGQFDAERFIEPEGFASEAIEPRRGPAA